MENGIHFEELRVPDESIVKNELFNWMLNRRCLILAVTWATTTIFPLWEGVDLDWVRWLTGTFVMGTAYYLYETHDPRYVHQQLPLTPNLAFGLNIAYVIVTSMFVVAGLLTCYQAHG